MTFIASIEDLNTRRTIHQATHDTPRAAWGWLADQREEDENANSDYAEYTDTYAALDRLASGNVDYGDPFDDWGYNSITGWGHRADGTGAIGGDTPALLEPDGQSPESDRGIAYRVEAR